VAPKGNKCFSVFCADTVPALISLGAQVTILNSEVAKKIPVEKLYTQNGIRPIVLSSAEVLDEIVVPLAKSLNGEAFFKFSFGGAVEFGGLNGAILLELEEDGITCHDARITVGCVSSGPIRIMPAEIFLKKKTLSEEVLQEVARIFASEVRPHPHHGYKPAYLRKRLEVELLRAFSFSWNAAREKVKDL
jgi:CO/xanthine dehydrogenase FAD-binding subunit